MQILQIVILLIAALIVLVVMVGFLLSEKGYKGPATDHFDGKRFKNPSGKSANGFVDIYKYLTTRKPDKWIRNYETYVRDTPIQLPLQDEVIVTFVNHSSFLIQYQGINILVDPVWSERCSPVSFAGPKRMRPPGINFKDLPRIDLVLISHNHYDHLDKATIKKIIATHSPKFICPLGVDHTLTKWGAVDIQAIDWYETVDCDSLKITATPANHFTSRGTFDRDKTLWSGFVINYGTHRLYYAGDSGYSDIFKHIGDRLGPMDLSLIPIGAYLPKWFMSPIHVSPIESVLIHQDVGSKQSIAMHFGTFPLADDGPQRPINELKENLAAHGIDENQFIAPEEGISYIYKTL